MRDADRLSVKIRSIRDDEIAAWVELRNAIDPRTATMPGWIEQQLRDEATARIVIARDGGDVVGVGSAKEEADRRGTCVGWMWFGVARPQRGRGIGVALYRELSRHLHTLGKNACDTSAWRDDEATLVFLRTRGFVEVERFEFLRLDLDLYEPRQVDAPPGITIVPLAERSGVEREMFEVYCEALTDIPSANDLTAEYAAFHSWEIAHPARRTDLSFLALHDDHVIGYATFGVVGGSNDATNVMTAVKREWRRRGVAAALKATQLAAAKGAGFRGIVTSTEARNDPMRRLNERLGYKAQAAQLIMRGGLA